MGELNGFKKRKDMTKKELLCKTVGQQQENDKRFQTVQIVLNNLNKKIKDHELKNTNDIMQSVILILALKQIITEELKIDDNKWNAVVEKITKDLTAQEEREFDKKHGFTTVDKVAEKDDFVVVAFDGTINGAPFTGGHNDGVVIQIGSKSFLEDFENGLIGKKKGDNFVIPLTFPESYGIKDLAGKAAEFNVTVLSVKTKTTQGDVNVQETK